MVAPLVLVGAVSGLAGLLFGKQQGGGSGALIDVKPQVEVGTKKSVITKTNTTSVQKTQNFTDARNFSFILNSPNSSASQRQAFEATQTPATTLSPTVAPTLSGGGYQPTATQPATATQNLSNLILMGGLAVGGIMVLNAFLKKGKDKK